ncbi:hypothetical protein F2R98_15340 [Alistipes onderdonkii]|nr:hypothetical protein F2R98_15340 [Alistipes onderdonkii]
MADAWWVLRLGIIKLALASALDFSYLWLTPKILPLGNVQINLTLPSLIRIFGCAVDTPSRHNQA